jgi:colanic acid biosynthesis glycosyl transferase WcaI
LYNSLVRILLLNLYYPPDTSATAKLVETVVGALAAKHVVTILCGRPSYDPTERRPWHFYQSEQAGRVRIIRVGSTAYGRVLMSRRVLNYLTYVFFTIPRALLIPCDVILAMTDPPFEGIVGAFVAMVKNKPYIYNIRDLYPDMAVGGLIVKPGLLSRIWERLHRWAMRRATKVVVLGEDMRNRILAKGVSPSNVEIVRDGAEIRNPETSHFNVDDSVVRTIREGFQFVLLHAGNLGFYGAWNTLIQGARLLAENGIGLVFVGEGAQKKSLESSCAGIPNIRFLPFFPVDKVPSVLAAADAHIITIKRGLEGVVVPSKLYGILAAAKPIVAVAPAECDVVSLGNRNGFAVSADPDSPAQFAECVRTIAADPPRLHKMAEAAAATAPEYERNRELEKLTALLDSAGYHGR